MSDHELESLLMENRFLEPCSLLASPYLDEEHEGISYKRKREEQPLTKPQVKARREKARREKMNRRFETLAQMSNPEDPKSDKASILLDAVVALKSLIKERDQLKQVNKYLEVMLSYS